MARADRHSGAAEKMAHPSMPAEIRRPLVELRRADQIECVPISWLWREWLARVKLHILAGAPGTGKTTIAMALAAVVTRGGRWPDGTRAPVGKVLIWSGEDDPADTLVPRLKAAGADLSHVHFIGDARDERGERRAFDPASDIPKLEHEAQIIGQVSLLIADPVVSAVTGDSHKNTEVRRALQPVVDLAARLNVAVLGITHFSKGSAGREPLGRVTGSVAFGAIARVVMVTAKHSTGDSSSESERRLLARAKSNIGPDGGGFVYELEQVALPTPRGDRFDGVVHLKDPRSHSLGMPRQMRLNNWMIGETWQAGLGSCCRTVPCRQNKWRSRESLRVCVAVCAAREEIRQGAIQTRWLRQGLIPRMETCERCTPEIAMRAMRAKPGSWRAWRA